jgi:hypothetical protein
MITFFRLAPEKPCVGRPAKSTDEQSNLQDAREFGSQGHVGATMMPAFEIFSL